MAIVFIRTIIIYILVLFGIKMMGKRQISELETSELVTTILLSNISVMPIQEPSIPLFYGIVPLLSLICVEVILSFICLKFTRFRQLISGKPKAIINKGIIDQKIMFDLRISIDDLMSQLRQQDIFDIRDVELAIVEINGSLSVYQKFQARNITTQMLNITNNNTNNSDPQFIIISDGVILEDNLRLCNKNKDWIKSILETKKQSLKNILLMTSDIQNNYVLIPKEL